MSEQTIARYARVVRVRTRLDSTTGRLVVVGSFCFSRVHTRMRTGIYYTYYKINVHYIHTCVYTTVGHFAKQHALRCCATLLSAVQYGRYSSDGRRHTRKHIHMYDSNRVYCVSAVRRRHRRRQWAPPRVKRINLARRLRGFDHGPISYAHETTGGYVQRLHAHPLLPPIWWLTPAYSCW